MSKRPKQPAQSSGESGTIERGKVYSLPEFMRRTGLRVWAVRTARRNGLVVRYVGHRGYVDGSDWARYLEQAATHPSGSQTHSQ
jgi:hypothetical protein